MANNGITNYISELNRQYQTGGATEHSYRPALQRLLEDIIAAEGIRDTQVTNEPKRIECGAPDYIVTRGGIPVGYIEAKDVGTDLNGKKDKAQFDRYKESLENIVFTDYLDFHFYRYGIFTDSVRVGEVKGGKIVLIKENIDRLNTLLTSFCRATAQSITSPDDLAKFMAAKARWIDEIINKVLTGSSDGGRLFEQLEAFKEILIHDITPDEFADVYAQTVAYGMFVARLHDDDPSTFSRRKVAELIPQTSPLLRELFDDIAGLKLDSRVKWIVDDLAEMFKATDINTVMAGFGQSTRQRDPIIHFYETFLSMYDKTVRKERGVWYTPYPAVNFIVRAVDDILQKEFDIKNGLADKSSVKIPITAEENSEKKTVEAHRVQILDPAVGTGTFLAEVVNHIYESKFKNQAGMWQGYAEDHLIPRLNGFELLMAPYTMAHVKLDMTLAEKGYAPAGNRRLNIYLTNSLEEHHKDTGTWFGHILAKEAKEANRIKRDAPIMVVMGNPPYNVSTQNRNDWIDGLIEDYKRGLSEKKLNLDDDYIKFIRYAQYLIEKNERGVIAYVSNNSFIDGVTHRQMRKTLLEIFDKIYILDLHGNSRKKEFCPDGGKDENIFDIQQGVSINIFVKTGRKAENEFAEVYHYDLWGKRDTKYDFLMSNNLTSVKFAKLQTIAPEFFFVPKNFEFKDEYESGFSVTELFTVYNSGIKTDRDSLFIDDDRKKLANRIKILLSGDFDSNFKQEFRVENSSSYKLLDVIKRNHFDESFIQRIEYRPFDKKWIYYSPELISRPASKVMRHFTNGENVGLISKRGFVEDAPPVFISDCIADIRTWSRPGMIGSDYVFPLYLYSGIEKELFSNEKRKPNINEGVIGKISKSVKLEFESEKSSSPKKYAPIDIFDYIYAVLHNPSYREKYKEFLKIDFPRVPYPTDAKQFRKLAKLGEKLRRLHLLEDIDVPDGLADYPIKGGNEIERPYYDGGKVYINGAQYFAMVPQEAWDFYIGGYQPAQKWLKDRKGRVLSYEDIVHYRKIVFALRETGRVMGAIADNRL